MYVMLCLSVCPSVCLSVYPTVCLSVSQCVRESALQPFLPQSRNLDVYEMLSLTHVSYSFLQLPSSLSFSSASFVRPLAEPTCS